MAREQREADWKLRGYVNVLVNVGSSYRHLEWAYLSKTVTMDSSNEPRIVGTDEEAAALATLVMSEDANFRLNQYIERRRDCYQGLHLLGSLTEGEELGSGYQSVRELRSKAASAYEDLIDQLKAELGTGTRAEDSDD